MVLDDQVRLAILSHSLNCLPDECCGLLAVKEGSIRFAYPLTNADPSPVSFTIDPDEHFGAFRHAESRGWEISGVFHSHPGGKPIPSMTDVAMAFDPDWVHLIVAADEIAAFRIEGGRIEEIPIWVVVKSSPTRVA